MDKNNASKFCTHCGTELAFNAKTCPKCGYTFKRPFYKKKRFLIPIIFFGFIFLSALIGSITNESNTSISDISENSNSLEANKTVKTEQEQSVFDGDCGITTSAQLGNSIIGQPELTISIKNTSNKDISAIKFFVEPIDVYGEKLSN